MTENKRAPSGLRTWVEVDRGAIKHNFETLSELLQETGKQEGRQPPRFMAVVKSNAYGHGLVPFAREMEQLGADHIGVDSIVEARRLRENGITTPILVLGYTLPENFEEAIRDNIELTLSSWSHLENIRQFDFGETLNVHVKIDTGMHRQGFFPEETEKLAAELAETSNVSVEGVYTHFANAKNPSFPHDTRQQMHQFQEALEAFENAGFENIIRHACATSGAILHPEYHYDMVRFGIGLYGLWPSAEVRRAHEEKITLEPALSWKSVIGELKSAEAGGGIGYDYTEIFEHDKQLAIIPVGYWHGYTRVLSSLGHALVEGVRARVLGRISMDITAVDVTGVEGVNPESIVILLGSEKGEQISADELGAYSGTSCYEVVTRINPKIERIYF